MMTITFESRRIDHIYICIYTYTRALTRSAPATLVHLPRLRVARNSSTTLLNCLERGLGERSKYPLGLLSPTTVSRGW